MRGNECDCYTKEELTAMTACEPAPIAVQSVIPPTSLDTCFTGGQRSSRRGRGAPHLLPFDAILEISKHFEAGVLVGYSPRNWEKGLPLSWYMDSQFRHMEAIDRGDTTEDHFRANAWNALCMLATKIRVDRGELPAELDDRRTIVPQTKRQTVV